MGKKYFLKKQRFIFLFLNVVLFPGLSFAQDTRNYKDALRGFFPFSPFEISSDSFFIRLVNDPDFVTDSLQPPTDTSLFYVRGYYKMFNPFSKEVKKVQAHFYQSPLISTKRRDKPIDTTLKYLLIGICDMGNPGKENAIKIAKAIHKKIVAIIPIYKTSRSRKKDKKYKTEKKYYYVAHCPVASLGTDIWYADPKKPVVTFAVDFGFINLADMNLKKQIE